MFWRSFGSVAVLPGTVLGVVPGLLLWAGSGTSLAAELGSASALGLAFGTFCAAAGLALTGWTVVDFARRGRGTLAPWNPPVKLLVIGPYGYVRNPMITGVVLILVSEALLLHAAWIAAWAVVFFLINTAYIPKREEPGLARRFGDDYECYRENVPRWIPRLTPWRPPGEPH